MAYKQFSYSSSNYYGNYTAYARVYYSEDEYDASHNRTKVSLSKVDFYVSNSFSACPCYGTVSFGGTTVKTFSGGYTNTASGGGWNTITGSSGDSSVWITHNKPSGTATMSISIDIYVDVISGRKFYVDDSGSVNLTTRTSTLTVNPNGGLWNNSSVSQSFSQAPTSTKIFSVNPTREGYNFLGWTKSGGGSWNASTSTYTFDYSNGTLTAGWSVKSYTLTTVASPLDAGTVTPGGTLDYDTTKTLTATPENITGYTTTFLNWTLSGPGSLTSTTTNPTTFTTGAGNATVTATFTKTANTYIVKFNGNGANSGTMADQSFTYDEAAKPLSTNEFIKNNYNFIGWNTKADGTGVSYEPGQSVQNLAPSGIFNLYAVWQLAGYTIQYSANGHGTPPASQIKVVGQNLTLQPYMPDQEENGALETYTIIGNANGGTWEGSNGEATSLPHHLYSQYQWNTKSNGTGIVYESQAVYTADSALSLYAIWNDNETREYTYMVPTGTPSLSQTLTVTFDANTGAFTSAATSIVYSSRDCEFEGWYTDPSSGVVRDSSSQVLASETVYAHYNDLAFSSVFTPAKNSCLKEHYELLGWAKNSNSTVPDYAPGIEILPVYSDGYPNQLLYAIWGRKGEVYIGGEKYAILIYDGVNWGQYQAYIANGSQWIPY